MDRVRVNPAAIPTATDIHAEHVGSLLRPELRWDSPDELRDRFHLEVVPSPSGVTHHFFWRK